MDTHSESPKQARKRKKIINTAIKLFVKYGAQATSMQTLAKKSGVATGSIYNYFENKEMLINDIFRLISEEESAFVTKGYDENASVEARFRYLVGRSIQYKLENPYKFQFRALYTFSPIIMKTLSDKERPKNYPFSKVAIDGQAQGLIKNIELEELFYFAHGGLASLLRWKLFEKKTMSDEDIQSLIDLTWDVVKR